MVAPPGVGGGRGGDPAGGAGRLACDANQGRVGDLPRRVGTIVLRAYVRLGAVHQSSGGCAAEGRPGVHVSRRSNRGYTCSRRCSSSLQLMLGATMRHQHAGLAIPDFPLAHGRFGRTDPELWWATTINAAWKCWRSNPSLRFRSTCKWRIGSWPADPGGVWRCAWQTALPVRVSIRRSVWPSGLAGVDFAARPSGSGNYLVGKGGRYRHGARAGRRTAYRGDLPWWSGEHSLVLVEEPFGRRTRIPESSLPVRNRNLRSCEMK